MRGLDGRIAVVTGGARGLGRAAATRLAEEGAKVAILDLRLDEAETVAKEIGGSAFMVDTTDEGLLAEAFKGVEATYGGLDILVNNAGIGYFLAIKAAYPMLKASENGRVINVASRTFFMGNVGQTPYVSAKGAVVGLTWNMCKELGGDGIAVNAVMPGQVATEGTLEYNAEEMFERTMQNQAIKKRVYPEHLAGLIAFLASDDGAMISGQSIVCDGGGLLH